FQTSLLYNIGTYIAKVKSIYIANIGYLEVRAPGIIQAKIYNYYKKLFSIIYSNY
ncbi:hypothetical protein BKA56DRAFT_490184, partial [Ilyonectria sp. MPI-CAGE-AT-0026]